MKDIKWSDQLKDKVTIWLYGYTMGNEDRINGLVDKAVAAVDADATLLDGSTYSKGYWSGLMGGE